MDRSAPLFSHPPLPLTRSTDQAATPKRRCAEFVARARAGGTARERRPGGEQRRRVSRVGELESRQRLRGCRGRQRSWLQTNMWLLPAALVAAFFGTLGGRGHRRVRCGRRLPGVAGWRLRGLERRRLQGRVRRRADLHGGRRRAASAAVWALQGWKRDASPPRNRWFPGCACGQHFSLVFSLLLPRHSTKMLTRQPKLLARNHPSLLVNWVGIVLIGRSVICKGNTSAL
jgi:hypothetical protein